MDHSSSFAKEMPVLGCLIVRSVCAFLLLAGLPTCSLITDGPQAAGGSGGASMGNSVSSAVASGSSSSTGSAQSSSAGSGNMASDSAATCEACARGQFLNAAMGCTEMNGAVGCLVPPGDPEHCYVAALFEDEEHPVYAVYAEKLRLTDCEPVWQKPYTKDPDAGILPSLLNPFPVGITRVTVLDDVAIDTQVLRGVSMNLLANGNVIVQSTGCGDGVSDGGLGPSGFMAIVNFNLDGGCVVNLPNQGGVIITPQYDNHP